MSRAGTPTDNPVIESLNGWIKNELYKDFKIYSSEDIDTAINAYIKYFNTQRLAYSLTGKNYKKGKMRKGNLCNCVEMVDIGAYNSCKHLCKYCYANYDEAKVNENYRNHDVNSSLLIGHLTDKDTIKVRKT